MSTGMICRINQLFAHPNADKLQLAKFSFGVSVIVGENAQEGDLGIYFPPGTQIDKDILLHNSLYRKHPDTGEPMGGYFEQNGRVKAIKLRGEISNGIFLEISNFSHLSGNLDWAIEGREIDSIAGKQICRKFIYEDKQQRSSKKSKLDSVIKVKYVGFSQVGDTPRFIYNMNMIKPGDYIVITEKLHGTSGRSGRVRKQTLETKWYHKLLYPLLKPKPKEEYTTVWGTRRTVDLNSDYYRELVHNKIVDMIPQDTVLYYEIVGPGIMPNHDTTGFDEIEAKYGKLVKYNYAVGPERVSIFLYRATRVLPDGSNVELPFWEVQKLADNLGIDTVPVLYATVFNGDFDSLSSIVFNELSDGPSVLDPSHPREGVVIRVNNDVYKHKGMTFCLLESIRPYHDPEDFN